MFRLHQPAVVSDGPVRVVSLDGSDVIPEIDVPSAVRHSVPYPYMRMEVMDALQQLNDEHAQCKYWLHPELGRYHYSPLDLAVHTLFDDTLVMEDPAGSDLLHPGEVEPMRALEAVFHPMIRELGDVRKREYLAHPQWPEVVVLARRALRVMLEDGRDPEAEIG